MKKANSAFHESFLFKKKIKLLNKNEAKTNKRNIEPINDIKHKKDYFNKTHNLFYDKISRNNNPFINITFRKKTLSYKKNNVSGKYKQLPDISSIRKPKKINNLKNKCISSKSITRHPLNYLNLTDNLKIKKDIIKDKSNILLKFDILKIKQNIKSAYNRNIKKNISSNNINSYNNSNKNTIINKNRNYSSNSVTVKILNPDIHNNNNYNNIKKINQRDYQLKKLLQKKIVNSPTHISHNHPSGQYKDNKNQVNDLKSQIKKNILSFYDDIPNILSKIKSIREYLQSNNINIDILNLNFLNQMNKVDYNSIIDDLNKNINKDKKHEKDCTRDTYKNEENKNNIANKREKDIFPVIKYIFCENIINNLKRNVDFVNISSEKEFNKKVLRIINNEINNSFFNNNIIQSKFNKDFKTYGYEFNPELFLKNKNDFLQNNNDNIIKKIKKIAKNNILHNRIETKLKNRNSNIPSEQSDISKNNILNINQMMSDRKIKSTRIQNFNRFKIESSKKNDKSKFNIYNINNNDTLSLFKHTDIKDNKDKVIKVDNFSQTERQKNIIESYKDKDPHYAQSEINKIILNELRSILNSHKFNWSIMKKKNDTSNKKLKRSKAKDFKKINIKQFKRKNNNNSINSFNTINTNIIYSKLNNSYNNQKKKIILRQMTRQLNNNSNIDEDKFLSNALKNKSLENESDKLSFMSQDNILSLFVEKDSSFNNNIKDKNQSKITNVKKNNTIFNNFKDKIKMVSFNLPSKDNKNQKKRKEEQKYIEDPELNIKNENINSINADLNKSYSSPLYTLNINLLEKNDNLDLSLKKQNSSQYEINKFAYIKNNFNYEIIKLKLDEINSKYRRNKSKSNIFSLNFSGNYEQKENLFMKRLKEEKYRNVIKKMTSQRKVNKNEYCQLKLDLNIENSSDENLEEEESGNDNDNNRSNHSNNSNSKNNDLTENEEYVEKEINFFGTKIRIKQNKKEKNLFRKYLKFKKLKHKREIKQIKTKDILIKELEHGALNENEIEIKEENNKKNKKNKKKIKIIKPKKRQSINYFINRLDGDYHSDSSVDDISINYFSDIDVTSLEEIEKRKEQLLLKFKNDILYKIKKMEMTYNELTVYEELVKRLKSYENNLSCKAYVKLLKKYFYNLDKQLGISEQRKKKEHRINYFLNTLIDDMDFLSLKKKKQEKVFCHVLDYNDINNIHELSNVK